MGAMTPPPNPRAFAFPVLYTLTPADEVRLLAEGLSADTITGIRNCLAGGWPYDGEFPLLRMKVYVGLAGVQITKY